MRRTKTGALPSVDLLEPRLLLSNAAPLLSNHAMNGVVREVRAIVSTLAKTQDIAQASAQLTGLASQIRYGSEGLAPSWQSDLGLYRPHSARSIVTAERRLVGDLDRFIKGGVPGGNQPVTGSGTTTSTAPILSTGSSAAPPSTPMPTPSHGTTGTPTPLPTPSLDSVRIQNTTGLALVVTVHLNVSQFQQPSITETIPANSIMLFDFGTATNDFMTMDVSRADGGQSPAPFNNINLSQPLTGYDGALFTISLFGPYFNVTFY